jgi:hypothetical protein
MTTPTRTSSNKTALRASLRKEDESLAERLVATDVPLVTPSEPEAVAAREVEAPVAAAPARKAVAKTVAAKPAAGKPGKAPAAQTTAAKPVTTKSVATKAAAKPAAEVTPATAAKAPKASKKAVAKKAPPAVSATPAAKAVSKKTAAAKASVPVKPAKTEAVAAAPAPAKEPTGKKDVQAEIEEAVEKLEKVAKEKGDKLVRYTVELLKSEEAAIEAVRAELSKAAGWAASKSDILRAGVRLFAEQRLEQMKELLAALSTVSKGKKKG